MIYVVPVREMMFIISLELVLALLNNDTVASAAVGLVKGTDLCTTKSRAALGLELKRSCVSRDSSVV